MMAHRFNYVWTWKFSETEAFVFIGDRMSPTRRWQQRKNFDSELHDVLRGLEEKPTAKRVLASPVYGTEARAIRNGLQAKLRSEGYKLLSARDRKTIKAGRKEPRSIYVMTCWGRAWFPSVRAAALALGVDHSTLSLAARNPNRLDVYFESTPKNKRKS